MTEYGSDPGSDPRDVTWLIRQFAESVPGVTHASVMSTDGLQLASAGQVDRNLGDQLAAVSSGVLATAAQVGWVLQLGAPELVNVRFGQGHVLFVQIGDAAVLFVAVRAGTDMRVVAFEMTEFVKKVGHALTPELRDDLHARTLNQATS